MYPVRFECTDEAHELAFTVELFDEACAKVEIKTLVTVGSWDEISAKVREALVLMELESGAEGVTE
jgi:hypothetical protein